MPHFAAQSNGSVPSWTRRLDVSASGRLAVSASRRYGGEGDRTPDLVNAIHALSQLSYAPRILGPAKRVPAGTRHLTGTFQWCQAISRPGTNFSSCGRYHRLIRDHTDAQAHSTEEDHLPRPGEAPNGAPPHGGGGRGGARGQGEARQEARAAPGASGRTRHP